MIEIPEGLSPELVPLSWLLGAWQGSGVVSYGTGDDKSEYEFGQRVEFIDDGHPYLRYDSSTWLLSDHSPLADETGFWRISRQAMPGDSGPGLLLGAGDWFQASAESVETLRSASGGFPLTVSILHPDGISELYLGEIEGPRINLSTDAVVRPKTAKEYSGATRMYGLVESKLLWAWDIAALGHPLTSHASAVLTRETADA